jgi:hypothetical protein
VRAESKEIGYLWSIFFDFDKSYDAILTIEVGPWKDGDLVEVHESSTTVIRCTPIGGVALGGGIATFTGGHLECPLDLAATVLNNHKLSINAVDTYGSILLRTRMMSNSNTVVPLFTHPDASYSLDFSATSSVTMQQQLWNGLGLSQANFMGVTINTWQTYTYLYRCISHGGPCDANFAVGPQSQSFPTAGSRVQFSTGPTSFQVGGAAFNGQIDALLIDPGNSAH